MLSAGEASGDRLGAGLAAALRARRPDVELFGMGGPRMAEAGVELVQRSDAVAVVGIVEVARHLGEIRRAMAALERCAAERRPDLLVPIDFPDFNLRLAARARRRGVEVVYFVSPQIWAWRRGRVRTIRRLVRRMLVLFPFEVGFYEAAGVPVSFVGHPAAEMVPDGVQREAWCQRAGLVPAALTVALVRGSGRIVFERLLRAMLAAAARIAARRPRTQFLLPVAPGQARERLAAEVERSGVHGVRLHEGDFPEILGAASAGIVASGTASLEAAIVGLPIVVVYRMSALTHAVGRMLVRLDHVTLPNLVAGRRVVPELIQDECTPERMAHEILAWLEAPERAAAVRQELVALRARLGGSGVFERAADAVLAELARRGQV
jgi:lipid-A-disaccharide synthase